MTDESGRDEIIFRTGKARLTVRHDSRGSHRIKAVYVGKAGSDKHVGGSRSGIRIGRQPTILPFNSSATRTGDDSCGTTLDLRFAVVRH